MRASVFALILVESVASVAGLTACGFSHGELGASAMKDASAGSDAADAEQMDAPAMMGMDATLDGMTAAATCSVSDGKLVWCLEFDEAGLATATTAKDGSGFAHDPTISNITLGARTVPAASQAVTLSSTSGITLTKPTDFNLQQFTIVAWMYRQSSAELAVLDTAFQYTLNINSNNHTVECAISNTSAQVASYNGTSTTALNEWDLVACTYDMSQVCTYSFRNGSTNGQKGCANRNSATNTAGTSTSVGEWSNNQSQFVGSLDHVLLYGRALTEQEICVAGGLTGC